MSTPTDLARSAIDEALSHNWDKAIAINESILQISPEDIDAMSRLAYAYCQQAEIEKAKKLYRKILNLDKYNYLAKKHLEKLNALPKSGIKNLSNRKSLSPQTFIEEPGKTKTVTLKNLAPIKILVTASVGDLVMLSVKKHSIEVRDSNKVYLGALPDDIAFRLIKLIKAGNDYLICIKNVGKNSLTVFIKETKRGKRFGMLPSFFSGTNDPSLLKGKRIAKDPVVEDSAAQKEDTEESDE